MLEVIFLALIPLTELSAAILYGIYKGLDPILLLIFLPLINSSVYFPIVFLLNRIYYKKLLKIKFFKKTFERIRKKIEKYSKKYGAYGLVIYRALPFPFSGSYGASIAAWFLKMDWKIAFLSIYIGSVLNAIFFYLALLGIFDLLFYYR